MSASQPLGGVKIALEGSRLTSTTTDGNGNYTFGGLRAGGVYTITPRSLRNFTPSSRSFNNLQRDESADFFAQSEATPTPTPTPTPPTPTPTPTPTPKPECSEAEQASALNTVRSFEPNWRRQIEGERARIIAENVPDGVKSTEASLGKIEFQYSFPRPCKAAVITARYAWQVFVPGNAISPGKSKSVPRKRVFTCGKFLGVWACH